MEFQSQGQDQVIAQGLKHYRVGQDQIITQRSSKVDDIQSQDHVIAQRLKQNNLGQSQIITKRTQGLRKDEIVQVQCQDRIITQGSNKLNKEIPQGLVRQKNGGIIDRDKQVKDKIKPVVRIRLLNVNHLNEGKYLDLAQKYLCEEVYKNKKEYNLIFLTETQERVESISIGEGVFFLSKMRGDDGKRGGGA